MPAPAKAPARRAAECCHHLRTPGAMSPCVAICLSMSNDVLGVRVTAYCPPLNHVWCPLELKGGACTADQPMPTTCDARCAAAAAAQSSTGKQNPLSHAQLQSHERPCFDRASNLSCFQPPQAPNPLILRSVLTRENLENILIISYGAGAPRLSTLSTSSARPSSAGCAAPTPSPSPTSPLSRAAAPLSVFLYPWSAVDLPCSLSSPSPSSPPPLPSSPRLRSDR